MADYGYTKDFLTENGKPWFPVMGEIHYSRYPRQLWKDSLYKMKAGGVNVISAYTIWIHHEEIEGEYNFAGNCDLAHFARCIDECGLKMILRVGPWCHGEVRNGGFPDWLLKKDFECRTNQTAYLDYVRRWYTVLYKQVAPFLCTPANPEGAIIGLQIENEYGHCGGMNGDEGEEHMKILAQMAKEIGFNVPLFTATGWGGAVTGGLVPVMGGYCEAPWDQRLTEIEPSGNYIFTRERNDHNIGSDFGFGTGITFDLNKFPYLTAELGGGLQVTRHRRPVAYAQDIGAMSLVKLGSGVNLLGYYMYHGGTNPDGKLSTLQESKETGSLNDLPELSYDFRAPIREYGQVSPTFKEIKLLTMFVHSFGEELCTFAADIPPENPLKPSNCSDLRYSFRHNGKSGYVFVNNYQRRNKLADHANACIKVPAGLGGGTLPALNVADKDFFFLPVNMQFTGAVLRHANATPLCKLNVKNGKNIVVFYARKNAPAIAPQMFSFEGVPEEAVLALSRRDALNAWKITSELGEHLVICGEPVTQNAQNGTYKMYLRNKTQIQVYPPLPSAPAGFVSVAKIAPNAVAEGVSGVTGEIYQQTAEFDFAASAFAVRSQFLQNPPVLPHRDGSGDAYSPKNGAKVFKIQLVQNQAGSSAKNILAKLQFAGAKGEAGTCQLSELFLRIAYEGESARLYAGGKLIADNLFCGKLRPEYDGEKTDSVPVWEIGLRRFIEAGTDVSELMLEILPLSPDARIYLESWPVNNGEAAARLTDINIEAEYGLCF